MSIISKILGSVFSGVGVIAFLYGMDTTSPFSLVWIVVGFVAMMIGFSLISAGRSTHERKPPPPTVTEIKCDSSSCDFKEIRNFENGDYILKRLDAKCPKCSSSMTVQGVYVVKEEEKEKTNV